MSSITLRQKITLVVLGLFLFIVLLEAGLRLGGWAVLSLQEYRNRASLRRKGTYRILCIGESTTMDQWPRPLEQILNQRDIGLKFSVIDKGLAGSKSTDLLRELEDNLNKYDPDMVIAMMGVNDTGDIIPYADIFSKHPDSFLIKLKAYKLIKLIEAHIMSKAKDIGILATRENKENSLTVVQGPKETDDPEKKNTLEKNLEIDLKPEVDHLELARYRKEKDAMSFHDAEGMLFKALEFDPDNYEIYCELGWIYTEIKNYKEAEEMFLKALKLAPEDYGIYRALGRHYAKAGDLKKAEEMLSKAIELAPENPEIYFELGIYCVGQDLKKAEAMFNKAIELSPQDLEIYLQLGRNYTEAGNYKKAEEMFLKALKLAPEDYGIYRALGRHYAKAGDLKKAEEMLSKAIELAPENPEIYFELGRYCIEAGYYKIAEEMLSKAIELKPNEATWYRVLGFCYEAQEKNELARKCFEEPQRRGLTDHVAVTVNNYRKLKEILAQRGIQMVAVQYPVRRIELLKEILGSEEGVIFVDNEKVFKERLKNAELYEYFSDMFAGDFGHCTDKGNYLLAENIASVVLKEVFKR